MEGAAFAVAVYCIANAAIASDKDKSKWGAWLVWMVAGSFAAGWFIDLITP